MNNYKKIIPVFLMILALLFVNSVVFGDESSDLINEDFTLVLSETDAKNDGGLSGNPGDSTTKFEGRVENSYHVGKLMTDEEQEAVLAAMQDAVKSQVIETIKTGIRAKEDIVDLQKYNITPDELNVCFQAVLNNCPDMYYLGMSYGYSIFEDGMIDVLYPEYTMEAEEIKATQAGIDAEVQKILDTIEPGMSRVEQIRMVNDYFAKNYHYDWEHFRNPGDYTRHFTIPALFIDKTAVCQGFGLGFQYVLEKLEIPCITVQSNEMNHLWNLVQAKEGSENWYHIDVTWNTQYWSESGASQYTFFLKSDDAFKTMKNGDVDISHHGFIPDGMATDTIYDNMPLTTNQIGTDIVSANGYWYFGKPSWAITTPETIYRINYSTGEYEAVVAVKDSWTVENTGGRAYSGYYFNSVWAYDNKLYYHDESKIYVFDPEIGSSKVFLANPKGVLTNTKCIYEMKLSGDTLIYTVAGDYLGNNPETQVYTVPLIDKGNTLEVSGGKVSVTLTDIEGANNICFAFFDAEGRFVGINMIAHSRESEADLDETIPSDVSNVSVFAVEKSSKGIKPIGQSMHKNIVSE